MAQKDKAALQLLQALPQITLLTAESANLRRENEALKDQVMEMNIRMRDTQARHVSALLSNAHEYMLSCLHRVAL